MTGHRYCYRFSLSLFLALTALLCGAQDSDDDDAPGAFSANRPASLSLRFDQRGTVQVNLGLPGNPASFDDLRSTLGQTLHCPPESLTPPLAAEYESRQLPKSWSAAQRERYRKRMAELKQRNLSGTCSDALGRHDGLLEADFDYAPLVKQLQRSGVDHLSLIVNLPRTAFRDYTRTHLLAASFNNDDFLMYEIPLENLPAPAILHVAYGFRRVDVYRGFAILTAFLVLPGLAVLWMRRGALASAKENAAGAWFGFMRTLNLLVMAAMLLWITSGLGARKLLQDWVAVQPLSCWGAAAGDVLVLVAPAFLIYLLCIALSYPVYAQLRQGKLSRREFLAQQMITVGAQALPLMLALTALEIWRHQAEVSVVMLILTLVLLQVFQILKLRVMKTYPQPLTTGELRDRIFALATRLGVKVGQIFVLPAGKGQVANAFATKRKVVMFTDYLLERLSKREVDAVAAHELAHLHHKHTTKSVLAFYAAILSPSYFAWFSTILTSLTMTLVGYLPAQVSTARLMMHMGNGMNAFQQWSQRDFVLVMLGLAGFYFLRRRFENVADATAVRLTADPESQIRGLLKLSRLNFVPIQWGKASEAWLTHPSMVRRAQRIATIGGMAPERLREILTEYAAPALQRGAELPSLPPQDRYAIPDASNPENIRHAVERRAIRQLKLWAMRAATVLPLAACSWLVVHAKLEGGPAAAAYGAGFAGTAVLLVFLGVWLGCSGYTREKRRLLERFAREKVPAGTAEDVFVGFAPTPNPRVFGQNYHWDSGFLVFARDRLQFVGEKTRFALAPAEMEGIKIGPGGPSWWKFERVYVRWKTADGTRGGVFNLYPMEPVSMWKLRASVHSLAGRMRLWQSESRHFPEVHPEFAALRTPELGQVTCASPRRIGRFSVNLRALAFPLALALGVCVLIRAEIWYVCSAVFALRLFQSVPYWRYRDRAVFPPASGDLSSKARGAGASAGEAQ